MSNPNQMTHELTIPAYAAPGLVNELNWLETDEPMAFDVMVAIESQLSEDYAEVEVDDAATYKIRLSPDHVAIVHRVMRGIEEEWVIDTSAGIE